LRKFYPAEQLPALTPGTITSRAELERELDGVRKRGFAVSPEESDEGLNAVARAVSDVSAPLRLALAVVGPASRFGVPQFPAAAAALGRAARELRTLL
jgi:DNA-binding IclR family transcriptional regulator